MSDLYDPPPIEIEGYDPLCVAIETRLGTIHGHLFEWKAPRTVRNFVGLATGRITGTPFFDGLSFHRVIPMFGIQGGDPRGDGTGGPGFIERMPAKGTLNHDRAGTLSMVSTGKDPTYGSQFFISEKAQEFLNGKQLVIGHCQSPEVIRKIARVKVKPPNRPVEPVKIIRVDARRGPALVPKSTK